jgi:hypothetical protein
MCGLADIFEKKGDGSFGRTRKRTKIKLGSPKYD